MAKKSEQSPNSDGQQQSTRKEALRGKKGDADKKKFLTAVYVVVGLIIFILLIAVVNEFFIAPNRAVTTVADESISLSEWQDRVEYERAQRVVYLEDLYEQTDGNVETIQQFASQSMIDLQDAALLGENILGQMAFETAACQELTSNSITDTNITAEIETTFNYGDDIENSISKEEFDEQFDELMANLGEYGVSEETYRAVIKNRLCQNMLMEQLAEEADLETEAEQVNALFLIFDTEEEAEETAANIANSSYLTVWGALDAIAAATEGAEDAPPQTALATELTWRTQDEYAAILGPETTALIFDLPLNEASGIIADNSNPEVPRYYIVMADGHELRDLPENTILEAQQQLLVTHLNTYLEANEEESNFWRNRIPAQPRLDPKFYAQPAPAPIEPVEGEGEDTE